MLPGTRILFGHMVKPNLQQIVVSCLESSNLADLIISNNMDLRLISD